MQLYYFRFEKKMHVVDILVGQIYFFLNNLLEYHREFFRYDVKYKMPSNYEKKCISQKLSLRTVSL